MTEKEKIERALYIAEKNIDYDLIGHCDFKWDDKEQEIEDIWEYITERKEIGSDAFRVKYQESMLLPDSFYW